MQSCIYSSRSVFDSRLILRYMSVFKELLVTFKFAFYRIYMQKPDCILVWKFRPICCIIYDVYCVYLFILLQLRPKPIHMNLFVLEFVFQRWPFCVCLETTYIFFAGVLQRLDVNRRKFMLSDPCIQKVGSEGIWII